jgi:hypothetical protein
MAAGVIQAATPRYIGTVTAEGALWVDSAGVSGHATLFEGSVVETQDTMASLRLARGVRVSLGAASRAQVFQDHLRLEKGQAQLERGSTLWIEARTLRITAPAGSRAVVSIVDSHAIEVGALSGEVQVRNALDAMVARVASSFGTPAGYSRCLPGHGLRLPAGKEICS